MKKKTNPKKTYQALVLFSGGLDSILAAKIMEKMGFKITAVIFQSCFLNSSQALKMAQKYKFRTIVKNFSKEQLAIVKTPRFGYGKNINPCLDCRILMFNKTKEISAGKKNLVIVSGEVLGQRPMSQNKNSFQLIEKKSGLKNKILRPLSGKLLPPTIYEKEGLVKRSALYAIIGKNRQGQFSLLKKYQISEYPTPGGGCLLTDPEFSHRLKKLLQKVPLCKVKDVLLLKRGRVFWNKENLIVVGRDEKDNKLLEKSYCKKNDIFMEPIEYPGPSLLIRNFGEKKLNKKQLEKIGKILRRYCSKANNKINKDKNLKIKLRQPTGVSQLIIKKTG